MTRERRVLVVGAGIGGLACAGVLARRGISVDAVELRGDTAIAAHGVGLGQSANALRALAEVGILDQCLAVGYCFDDIKFFDRQGRYLTRHVFQLGGGNLPAYCALSRADLHRFLRQHCADNDVRLVFGDSISSIQQTPDGVHVQFDRGESSAYDAVVGFDGVRSRVRSLLFGARHTPRYLGYGVWRVTVPRLTDVRGMQSYHAVGSKTALLPIGNDTMYLAHIRPEQANARYAGGALRELLLERLDGYGGRLRDVISALTDTASIVYSPLEQLMLSPTWHVDRVIVAGDAAHVFPPHLTQGAGMALEDAVILAKEIATAEHIKQAFSAFMHQRYSRTKFVHDTSIAILQREQAPPDGANHAAAVTEIATDNARLLALADVELEKPVL